MLKIKDSVDFKELEKFGFKKKYSTYTKVCKGFFNSFEIKIDASNSKYRGKICFLYWRINEIGEETLFDLIKADLVEKVEN